MKTIRVEDHFKGRPSTKLQLNAFKDFTAIVLKYFLLYLVWYEDEEKNSPRASKLFSKRSLEKFCGIDAESFIFEF